MVGLRYDILMSLVFFMEVLPSLPLKEESHGHVFTIFLSDVFSAVNPEGMYLLTADDDNVC